MKVYPTTVAVKGDWGDRAVHAFRKAVQLLIVTSAHVLYSVAICAGRVRRYTLSSCAHSAATAAATCMYMMPGFSSAEAAFAAGTSEPCVHRMFALMATVQYA